MENTNSITPEDIVKAELLQVISEYFQSMYLKDRRAITYEDWVKASEEILPQANIAQLWSLYSKFVKQGTVFKCLHCNPSDHLAITFAGMYVGIELDGYTHS